MIKIRSITYNLPLDWNLSIFNTIQKLNVSWHNAYPHIRTTRLNLPVQQQLNNVKQYEEIANISSKLGIRWFNVPLDPWNEYETGNVFTLAHHILKEYDRAFVHIIGVKNKKIDCSILSRSAKLIEKVSKLGNNGHENFRLGISCNGVENTPFFPFTMSSGVFSYSIALELTQEINGLLQKHRNKSLNELRDIIIASLEQQIDGIEQTAMELSKKYDVNFAGFDFSLAPIIEKDGSVWPILQHLGIQEFGTCGSLFATYYLTDILKSFGQKHKMVGFSGVMYSLLEDLELCRINNMHSVKLEHLVAMSTMCGCGLDMIPIYSDTAIEEMVNLMLELAAVSNRLDKPLGIRLLPIPNTYKGKIYYTRFSEDADFVANTRLVDLGKNVIEYGKINQFEFIGGRHV